MHDNASTAYILARRWETRLMISWIVVCVLTACGAMIAPHVAAAMAIITITLGLVLYTAFTAFITPNYVDLEGQSRLLLALPPVMVSALFFGILERWMRRMGFGSTFRVCVTAGVVVLLTGPFVPAAAAPLLLIGSLASALLRMRTKSALALLPASLVIVVAIILKFMMVPA